VFNGVREFNLFIIYFQISIFFKQLQVELRLQILEVILVFHVAHTCSPETKLFMLCKYHPDRWDNAEFDLTDLSKNS